jgi:uncharacterized sulfatase
MSEKRPDILFIVLDTLRRDRLSIYGHPRETSPNFDAFAAGATLFERAVAPAQWTIPAHASMFTGLYPSTHQLTQADGRLSGSYATLAEILQAGGYHTVGFCNNPLVGVLDNGLQRGFTQFYNYAGAAPNRPFEVRRGRLRAAMSARWSRFARAVSQHFAQSDLLFRVSLNPLFVPVWTRYINYKGHSARSIDDLTAYIARHRQGDQAPGARDRQPLFTFLNLMGTHLPYRPPQDYVDRFAPDVRHDKSAYRFMARFNADAARWASPADPPLNPWERAVIDGFYEAEIAYQDDHLGRLLRWLKVSGALEDTMVIITADHGEGHGDHQFFGHSFVVYQELVHVPLAVHYPARYPAGMRASANVSTRRIFHTVLDAAGLRSPADESDPNADVTGLSLANTVPGASRPGSDHEGGLVFAEAFPPTTLLKTLEHRNPAVIDRLRLTHVRRGVYQGEHKLAVVADQVEGLFDVSRDPLETRDLSAQHTALTDDLRRQIGAFVTTAESYRAGGAAFGAVSDEILDHLRGLGYIE